MTRIVTRVTGPQTVAMRSDLDTLNEKYARLEAARALTEWTISKAIAAPGEALAVAEARIGRTGNFEIVRRSATAALLGTDQGLDVIQPLRAAWGDLVRRRSFLGAMSSAIRRVPPAVPITVVDVGTSAGFVTQAAAKPVVRQTLTDSSLVPGSIPVITVHSREALRQTDGKIQTLIERDHARALALGENAALLDGAAAVAGGRPASILFGVSPVGSGSPADLEADVVAMLAAVRGGEFAAPFFLASLAVARYLLTARDATSGDRLFPDVTAVGGSIHGIPLLVSAGVADVLALVDADAILVVDDDVRVDVSRQTALQMDSAPSAGAADVVSMFQANSVAILSERSIGWRLAWADGAAYLDLSSLVI